MKVNGTLFGKKMRTNEIGEVQDWVIRDEYDHNV